MKKDFTKIFCVDYLRNIKIVDSLNTVGLLALSIGLAAMSASCVIQSQQIWSLGKDKTTVEFLDGCWNMLHRHY